MTLTISHDHDRRIWPRYGDGKPARRMSTSKLGLIRMLLSGLTHTAFQLQESREMYTQGEVASQNLWSRYDRHFVGIIRHNA